ncbi:MAG: molecular chaperone DnaJ [Armatimonadota bacterium]|nr:molecular chaperone DnaJ [Armatimonadota bacterium]MDR7439757.1 molecular chaperone DnaJ [Armatimonadota bacterium]MDR7562282.1 molecular chaperone DnaJ [Armatimonadota bacterium]MDR7568189.1 molecular chaperone DnaJ [Armatimonadota bacterium]MDR7602882.1 molecular chaperone DnaJ [Armatimonadota bacterium]
MPRDYYEILNVSPDASQEEIHRAYRRLAREYHPDVNRDPQAEERFKEINEAYQILSDPQKRAEYDRMRRGGLDRAPRDFGFPFEDLVEAFFGGMRPGPAEEPIPERGADLRYDLEITLEEAAHGTERTIEVTRQETCPGCFGTGAERGGGWVTCPTCGGSGQTRFTQRTLFGTFTQISTCRRCAGHGRVLRNPCTRCGGTGRVEARRHLVVNVPAGVQEGAWLRLAGEGEAGRHGGPRGDLYVVVHLARHPVFERRGLDLYCTVPLSMTQAALGDEVEVPTLDGPKSVTVPPGTQPGEVLTLKGYGLPSSEGRRGDLHVRFEVRIPKALEPRERQLLLEFARLRGERLRKPPSLGKRVRDLLR